MSDISIGKSFGAEQPKSDKLSKGEYKKAEKAYKDFKQQMRKSDFANSPSANKSELQLLSVMLEAAIKEGLEDKVAGIEARIDELKSSSNPDSMPQIPYYLPLTSPSGTKKQDITSGKGAEIKAAFPEASDEHKDYLIHMLTDGNAHVISDSVAAAMESIGKTGAHPNVAITFFEHFAKKSSPNSPREIMDMSVVDKFIALKDKGIEDYDAIKILTLFNENYEDKNILNESVNTLVNAKIKPEKIIGIIDALSVWKTDTDDILSLSLPAVKNVVSLKNMLARTENVEIEEQNNPVNLLNTIELSTEDDVIVMKNNQVAAIYPKSERSQQAYSDYMSDLQDDTVLDFAQKYTDKNGDIQTDALRVMTSLRRSGVSMNHIASLADFCYKKGKINTQNLNAVNQIKKAGALSSDVLTILSAVNKDDDGNYNQEDMENAQSLTSMVIDGQNVAELLPLVRGIEKNEYNINLLDLIEYLSPVMENKSNLTDIAGMAKKEDGTFDDNAIEIMSNLAKNFLYKDDDAMPDIDFVLNTRSIINAAKNPNTNSADDAAAGICSIMCNNNESPENILRGLHICKNQDGVIDENLADILWQMSLEQKNINDIEKFIDKCKDDTGNVNQALAKSILQFYEAGYKTDKIMEMVLNTG